MNDRLHERLAIAPDHNALLEHYTLGASLFSSPGSTLLAHGVKALLPACAPHLLPAAAARMLRESGAPGDVLMGAVPFNPDARARLFVPRRVGAASPWPAAASAPDQRSAQAVRMQPSPATYRANVEHALASIAATDLEKVVLSRSLQLDVQVDLAALLPRLAARNRIGYTFAIDLTDAPAPRRTLVGASPELLLARHGKVVLSHPLAGSIARSADPVQDRERADALLASNKDLHEHALVVDAVAEVLRPFCRTLDVPVRPALIATPTMWHLGTQLRGELFDDAPGSLELALALHPTPAVCGHPRESAQAFIDGVEGFERGFFAGLVGWCNAAGDGEWAVTLRCAEVSEHGATLYAGAGIVAGSDPARELLETSGKLRTMLAAMGLESALESTPGPRA